VIEVINRQQLTDLENEFGALKTGRPLTDKDLDGEPQADYWPRLEPTSVSAETRLSQLKSQLETVYSAWTQALLSDLADPVIQANFELLKPAQKKMIQEFVAAKQLPDEISKEFLDALQHALSGLTKLNFDLSGLRAALFPDGSPATPDEVRRRMGEYLDQLLKGRDPAKVRIVVS
jgi:hypothetical protein